MSTGDNFDSLSAAKWIDQVCDSFENAWQSGQRPLIDHHLEGAPVSVLAKLLRELVSIEIDYRRFGGELVTAKEYVDRFPGLAAKEIVDLLEMTIRVKPADARLPVDQTQPAPKAGHSEGKESSRRIHYFGDYVLLEKTARGGMGTVYRARQISLNRIVAVKMINSGQFASKEEIHRFYCEAESAASLDHPNIVSVHEVGEFEGDHFYSMAFVEGSSLAEKLTCGPMEPREAAEFLTIVAKAVQYAHDRGVIHRDLKPSNILLDADGRPRVSDFGLAKRVADATGLTVSGDVLGSPSYMPPEQAAGKIDAVGFHSDVYSLGAVLYACLSGRPPFQAASHLTTLSQVIHNEPILLRQLNPAIPRDLETIVHKCLEKAVSRRYSTPRALADDLARFLAGEPIAARQISSMERAVRWCRRHPAQTLNVAGGLAIFVALVVGWRVMHLREAELASVQNAGSLVKQLAVASDSELPSIVQRVWNNPRTIPVLRELFEKEPSGSSVRYRAAIGLLKEDERVVSAICQSLIHASWIEWNWINYQLANHPVSVLDWLHSRNPDWIEKLTDGEFSRFQAMRAMYELDKRLDKSNHELDSGDRERVALTVIEELQRDSTQMLSAANALYPLRFQLAPFLAKMYDHLNYRAGNNALVAANLVAELFKSDPQALVDYGWSARSEYFPIFYSIRVDSEAFRQVLRQLVEAPFPTDDWELRNAGRRKRALAAVVLFSLGESEVLWPLLVHSEDPSVRCLIIDWIPILRRDPGQIIVKLSSLLGSRAAFVEQRMSDAATANTIPNPWLAHAESSQLRSVIQILGNYPTTQLQRVVDESLWQSLAERFDLDPDPGVRASCEWCLNHQGRSSKLDLINANLSERSTTRPGWYVTSTGQTMVQFRGPIQFVAGADPLDPDRDGGHSLDPTDQTINEWSEDHRHTKRISRSFAIAAHETSFRNMHEFDGLFHVLQNKNLGPTLEHPAWRISWYKAAVYCNWLSKKEDIPESEWCFLPDEQGEYGQGMQLARDYLHRTGYRLPTEAEWEYACRAGTSTRRYFGDSDELIDQYSWYMRNSNEKILQLPRALKPNEFGLFHTLGNLAEWCMDDFDVKFPNTRFKEDDLECTFANPPTRILRGSWLFSMANDIRASEYSNFAPSKRDVYIGFRVARTLVSE